MRINRYLALATGFSRRDCDELIKSGRVSLNGQTADLGQEVNDGDDLRLDDKSLSLPDHQIVLLHKPVGYVVSRSGQGNRTIYDLLPQELHNLKPVGRLDKDSSGLLLLTNDGILANSLTHPSKTKNKLYQVLLDKDLSTNDQNAITAGVKLNDGVSKLLLTGSGKSWVVTMHEGRNRQIRRTFDALGYRVIKLHRTRFGPYELDNLGPGEFTSLRIGQ